MNVVELTKELVAIPSVSRAGNKEVSDLLHSLFDAAGCQVERQEYEAHGTTKVNLVAKIGEGSGGLAFCSHSDTVPGQEVDWAAFDPKIDGPNLFGRGSCDMKGPLAATMVAAFAADPSKLKKPIYIIVTADEELGLQGAKYMAENSVMLAESKPEFGIIAEPTCMIPVYSHKGFAGVNVTATGRAAHSSTGLGINATLLMAPFLAEMAELDKVLQEDASYMNAEYTPPHHSMNLVIDDGNCALNVTCPSTTVRMALRAMPNARSEELINMIADKARGYGFEADTFYSDALFCPVSAEIVQTSVALTGKQPETVPYGTDGIYLKQVINQQVVLGPGDIAVAHTVGEYVPVAELHQAVDVYSKLIEHFCVNG